MVNCNNHISVLDGRLLMQLHWKLCVLKGVTRCTCLPDGAKVVILWYKRRILASMWKKGPHQHSAIFDQWGQNSGFLHPVFWRRYFLPNNRSFVKAACQGIFLFVSIKEWMTEFGFGNNTPSNLRRLWHPHAKQTELAYFRAAVFCSADFCSC